MRRTLLLASLAGLLAASSPRAARAQNAPGGPSAEDRAEARRNFQAGVAAYGRRDFEAALASFQTAYRLAPHPTVRVNMANCYVELRRPAEAIAHFEQFLVESPGAPAAQRSAIERQLRTLLSQVAEVRISVTPGDAMGLAVTVDGQTVSTARPARVAPGRHVIEAFADGYSTARQEIDAAAGAPQSVSLALTRAVAPPAPVATPPEPVTPPAPVETPPPAPVATPAPTPAPPAVTLPPRPADDRRGRMRPGAFFAVAGVTVASAIAWGVTGGLALSARDDYDAAQARLLAQGASAENLAARQDARDSMTRLALISDIAMGVTLAGAVASVVLLLRTDFRPPTVDVAAAPLPGGGAVSMTHRF